MSGKLLWDILLSFAQPVFTAGRIRNEIKAREWEKRAAVNTLREVVLASVGEIRKYWGIEKKLEHKLLLDHAYSESSSSYIYFGELQVQYKEVVSSGITVMIVFQTRFTELQLPLFLQQGSV